MNIEHGKRVAKAATKGGWVEDEEVMDGEVAVLGGLGAGRAIEPGDRRVICAVSYPYLSGDVNYAGASEDMTTDEANLEHIVYHDPEKVLDLYAEIERLQKLVGSHG